jgi:hypothetical protein
MVESNRVLYYLGAGASANVIPAVKGLRPRILDLIIYLKEYQFSQPLKKYFSGTDSDIAIKIKSDYSDTLDEVLDTLQWLYDNSKSAHTIDVLAKELYTKESSDFIKLKKALIIYFYFEQACLFGSKSEGYDTIQSSTIDTRYNHFISQITRKEQGKEIVLNPNVKICSWNYDVQFELNLMRIVDAGILRTKDSFQIYPNLKSINKDAIVDFSQDSFAMFKLNGTALPESSHDIPENLLTAFDNLNEDGEYNLLNFLKYYKELYKDKNSSYTLRMFNFSFEEDDSFSPKYKGAMAMLEAAKSIMKNVDILVIIGYSFPESNSKTDKLLLDLIEPKQIIIQDLTPESILEKLFRRCPTLKKFVDNSGSNKDNPKVEINLSTDVETFYMPDDLLS